MVSFSNSAGARPTNCVTLSPVMAGTVFSAALYYAPDGETNLSSFVILGSPTRFMAPGIFYGGTRTTPATTPPGGYAMFQVRVWETAWGTTFEGALCGPGGTEYVLQYGRGPLVWMSNVGRMQTGDLSGPQPPPPPTFVPARFQGCVAGGHSISVSGMPPPDPYPSLHTNVQLHVGTNGTSVAGGFVTDQVSLDLTVTDPFFCGPAVLRYETLDGTAMAGADYVPTNGLITFGPEDLPPCNPMYQACYPPVTKSFAAIVLATAPADPAKYFSVRLSHVNGSLVLWQNVVTYTIIPKPFLPRPRLTELRKAGDDLRLSFETVTNCVYALERSTALGTNAVWTTVGTNVPGRTEGVTVTDQGAAALRSLFYRVQVFSQ